MKKIILQLGLIFCIVIYLAGLAGIITFTGSHTLWFGFAILWYWGMVAKAEFKPVYEEILPGVLFGILCVNLMSAPGFGLAGIILIPMLLLICSINKWLPWIINRSTFLTLTILTIPAISATVVVHHILVTTIITTAYIAMTAYIKEMLTSKKEIPAD